MGKQHKAGDVEILPIEQGATPDPNNLNKHTQRGRGLHENSMRKRGIGRSIFSAGKGVDVPVVMGGNQTLEIATSLDDGDKHKIEMINVHTNGRQIVNVIRDDIEPGSAEFYALAIEDNEIGKVSYAPDVTLLAQMAAGDNAVLAALRKSDKIFNGIIEGMSDYMEQFPDSQKAGSSPWERMGQDGKGVLFVFGSITCKLETDLFEKFLRTCPGDKIKEYVTEIFENALLGL